MGCELGKLASSGSKKSVDNNLNDPPAPVATDDRLPLTARQKWTMVASWKAISRAMEPTGVNMFVKWVHTREQIIVKWRYLMHEGELYENTSYTNIVVVTYRRASRHQMRANLIVVWKLFSCFIGKKERKEKRQEKREKNDSTSLAAAFMAMFSSAELLSYASSSGEGVVVPKQSCERREKFIVFKLPQPLSLFSGDMGWNQVKHSILCHHRETIKSTARKIFHSWECRAHQWYKK